MNILFTLWIDFYKVKCTNLYLTYIWKRLNTAIPMSISRGERQSSQQKFHLDGDFIVSATDLHTYR